MINHVKKRRGPMKSIKTINLFLGICFIVLSITNCGPSEEKHLSSPPPGLKFEIFFPENVIDEITNFGLQSPITGRVYAIISRNQEREPRFQTGFTGVPIWGKNVYSLEPGEAVLIDEGVFGYPLESIKDIPPGEYYVQGFINIYTEFKRSDGHTLWMHNDQWEGQKWYRSPGNLYSDVKKVYIDPSREKAIKLECKKVIPPVEIPPDTKWVKRIKFQSKILTKFWNQPIYLGATILLPKDFGERGVMNFINTGHRMSAPG
jgi:hypothetical protein